jgi:NAD(P)-dependent dehydrogenase (short-subunit alcohol dehydrogenase family)
MRGNSMNTFKDKIAVVTGGASGVGRALCEVLSRQGGIVVVADINAAGASYVAATLNDPGSGACGPSQYFAARKHR